MRDYIRLAGVLLIVCVVAAVLLGYVNSITFEKIEEQSEIANDQARKAVLTDATEFSVLDENKTTELRGKYDSIIEVYEAKANGSIIGYAVKTSPKGYGGPVEITIGIALDGTVKGINVGNNSETPGLGKKAQTPGFQAQYVNKTWASEIKVIKSGTPKEDEVNAISGSTITSKAVTKGVNQALAAAKELSGK